MELYGVLLTMRCCWGNLVRKAERPLQTPLRIIQNNIRNPLSSSSGTRTWPEGQADPLALTKVWCCTPGVCSGAVAMVDTRIISFSLQCVGARENGAVEWTHPVKEVSYNHLGWKRPLRSLSTTINPALSPSGDTAF